ncbi:MAG: hypothetical protein J0G32_00160 [Alphaproteobacteria bacterium]|nr:hypothetical protein [Alphaproteobacteria bacterium]OJV12122.1 MAG: hypothetical protein BGO27_05220 [Alphaproteobacteria bacterium 33-17]
MAVLMTSSPYNYPTYLHKFVVSDIINPQELYKVLDNPELLDSYIKSGVDLSQEIPMEFCITTNSFGQTQNVIFSGKATLLHAIVFYSLDTNVIDILKQNNVDLNLKAEFIGSFNGGKPEDGTILQILAGYDDTRDMVMSLLENDAKTNILNSQGETFIDILNFPEYNYDYRAEAIKFMEDHDLINLEPITFDQYQASLVELIVEEPVQAEEEACVPSVEQIEHQPEEVISAQEETGWFDNIVNTVYGWWH